MVSFGLGTIPALLAAGMSVSLVSARTRLFGERTAAVFIILMGALLAVRGLGARSSVSGTIAARWISYPGAAFYSDEATDDLVVTIKLIHCIGQACSENGPGCFFSLDRHFLKISRSSGYGGWRTKVSTGSDLCFKWPIPIFKRGKSGAANVLDYGLDALVSARSASLGDVNPGKRKVKVVMYDEHPARRDTEIFDDLAYCLAAPVHKGERLYEQDFSPLGHCEAPGGAELALRHTGGIARDQMIDDLQTPRCGGSSHILFPDFPAR